MKKTILLFIAVLVLVTSMACSCSFIGFDRLFNSIPNVVVEAGSGVIATREVAIGNTVKEVEVNSIGILHLSQGEEASLTIEAEDNYIDRIETEIQDDRLVIKIKNEWFNSWVPTKSIHYYLTLPDLTEVELDGAIRLEAEALDVENLRLECNGTSELLLDTIDGGNITLKIAGASNVEANRFTANTVTLEVDGVSRTAILDLQAQNLTVDISGGGALTLAGSVAMQNIDIDGGGSYQAENLRSDDAIINNNGAASITIWAEESLDIDCDGAARIAYYGTPKVHQNNSGFAVIESMGAKEGE